MLSRICWSTLFAVLTAGAWSGVVFISYIFLSKSGSIEVSAPMYVFLCLSFIGWIILAINAGIGIVYLPFDLIEGFFNRPK
jgi:hypothetical protein